MQNHLSCIGHLLMEIRRKERNFSVSELELQELKLEFFRVRAELTDLWGERPDGLEYLLEFHQVEAERLLGLIDRDKLRPYFGLAVTAREVFRLRVYKCLHGGLAEVLDHLRALRDGDGISLDIF